MVPFKFFYHNFLVNFNAKWSQGVKKEFFYLFITATMGPLV